MSDKRFEEAVSARDEFSEPLMQLRAACEGGVVQPETLEELINIMLGFRKSAALKWAKTSAPELALRAYGAQRRMLSALARCKNDPHKTWVFNRAVRVWKRRILELCDAYDEVVWAGEKRECLAEFRVVLDELREWHSSPAQAYAWLCNEGQSSEMRKLENQIYRGVSACLAGEGLGAFDQAVGEWRRLRNDLHADFEEYKNERAFSACLIQTPKDGEELKVSPERLFNDFAGDIELVHQACRSDAVAWAKQHNILVYGALAQAEEEFYNAFLNVLSGDVNPAKYYGAAMVWRECYSRVNSGYHRSVLGGSTPAA